MSPQKKQFRLSGFYYGWVIVVVALVSTGFWMGIRASFSVFFVALLDEFQWNRGAVAGVQSIALLIYTLFAPIVGGLIDRFGPRKVIIPGIIILFSGQLMCSLVQDMYQLYLFYSVVTGIGITSIAIVSYSTVLAHWFEKKRGLASGIAVSGMGFGTFFLVPLSQQLILSFGWRATFAATGVLLLIVLLPLNGFFLRHKPQQMGLNPDGRKDANADHPHHPRTDYPEQPHIDWTFSKAIKTGAFWYLLAFVFFSFAAIFLIFVHNLKFMVDHGIDKMTAAFVFFGMGWGVMAPMFMAVSADLFTGKGFGLIYGTVEGAVGLAGALGAWVGGFIFDQTGSYQIAFILAIFFLMLSMAAVWLAAPRRLHPVGAQSN